MTDPLAEVVTLLQPGARYSKLVFGAGAWRISRSDGGEPFYCVILEGGCRLSIGGQEPVELVSGDFALVPAAHGIAISSLDAPPAGLDSPPPKALGHGEFRIGDPDAPIDLRMLAGHCSFGSPDASLLVSLLPRFVHVRGEQRLATLVRLVREESREQRPARDVVLARLLEVLLIEALRSTADTGTSADKDGSAGKGASASKSGSASLVRGLADARLAGALRAMHERPMHDWSVAELAAEAALSRSTFFERFGRTVGVAPMEYLLAWRMALAKDLLRRHAGSVAEIAQRVGYNAASTFSAAFARHVGCSPTQYARGLSTEPASQLQG
jgi:AraC-like DNA-binding protein